MSGIGEQMLHTQTTMLILWLLYEWPEGTAVTLCWHQAGLLCPADSCGSNRRTYWAPRRFVPEQ